VAVVMATGVEGAAGGMIKEGVVVVVVEIALLSERRLKWVKLHLLVPQTQMCLQQLLLRSRL
jgi:hypothetical protein